MHFENPWGDGACLSCYDDEEEARDTYDSKWAEQTSDSDSKYLTCSTGCDSSIQAVFNHLKPKLDSDAYVNRMLIDVQFPMN